jgi:chloramphenicol 3-O-phosphotransferase
MAEQEPINLVLEHLRVLRADVGDIRHILREHGARFTALEATVAGLRLSIDRLDERVERIERRLGLGRGLKEGAHANGHEVIV